MRSRLQNHTKKQTIHILLGIIGILIFLGVFGTQLIIAISVGLDKIRGKGNAETTTSNVEYLAPPVLDTLPDATNKESVSISGNVITTNTTIILYVNGLKAGEKISNADNNFTFEDVRLDKGENLINAKAVNENKQSNLSQIIKIQYLNKEPILEISSPLDNQTFKKDQSPIRITGKTDKNVKVTINDFWAISDDEGAFYYQYNLKDSDNNLKIVATDSAGNQSIKEIKINVE